MSVLNCQHCAACVVAAWYRGSKDRDIITSIMLRMSTWQFCPAHGKTFPDHKSWMALVKKDPAAKTQLMQIMHQFFGQ